MAQINKPSEYFNTKLYTGTGSSNSVTGVGFQPDWVWGKNRSTTNFHAFYDAVRGATKVIQSNTNTAEQTFAQGLTSFDSDGFTVGTDGDLNGSGNNIVTWNWKANGSGVSNTDGSITSTVSASTTSGFSIVKYTGTGANATVGHGLGAVPKFIIVKALNDPRSWITYNSSNGASGGIDLNGTGAFNSNSTLWNNTTPTSSVVHLGTSVQSNSTYDYIMYCFAEKKGFSKFGSYTGNGNADGTFVYTGFKPALVIQKHYSGAATEGWQMWDVKRNPSNLTDLNLMTNDASAEFTATARAIDILSNGFKCRGADNSGNASGQGYIYMAFAEEPLVSTAGVPCTAR